MTEASSIVAHVLAHSSRTPYKTAAADEQASVSYGELWERVVGGVYVLKSLGVKRGDRVLLSASNTLSFVYGYLATHLAGAVAVPVDPGSTHGHLENIVDQVLPRVIFVGGDVKLESRVTHQVEKFSLAGPSSNAHRLPEPDEVADILFTTGTTGAPKGVMLTHRNIQAAAKNINAFIGNGGSDCELVPLPLSHSFGLGRLRCNMLAGGTIILVDGLVFPGKIIQALDSGGVTGFACVPSGFGLLFRLFGDKLGDYRSQLTYIEIGSAPMPTEHKERLSRLLPHTRICMHYGMTEASRATFLEFHEWGHKLGSIGRASPNVEIEIVDELGGKLPAENLGEIVVRGEMVMKGYWNSDEDTRSTLKDGYLRTGDFGYVDKEGFVYLQGRSTDLINVGGRKVAPGEVEEALKSHQSIEDCVCVSVPDPRGLSGEAVKAFVVASADAASRPTDAQLVGFLRGKVESYKLPAAFEWIDKIPTTSSGKAQREILRNAGHSWGRRW